MAVIYWPLFGVLFYGGVLLRLLTANTLVMPNRSTVYLVKRFYNKVRGLYILVLLLSTSVFVLSYLVY
jgi:hypothetical protein